MSGARAIALAAGASLALSLAAGRPLIAAMRRLSFRQTAYDLAPETHAKKSGTPTMGGVLFAIGLALGAAAGGPAEAAPLLAATAGFGAIGLYDDVVSIRHGRNRGLGARQKFGLTIVAGAAALALARRTMPPELRGAVLRLGDRTVRAPAPLWYALGLCALLATTHAVNLTDGLDGLAGGTVLPPLALAAWLGAREGSRAVVAVDACLGASVLGFLAYNRHPARVFMGDTGALALGGALAGSAILSGNVLVLPLACGVPLAEALSVILQVASFKLTRKRIFRMSPLHHHFELGGWPETRVTARFWAASTVLSAASAAIARFA